MEVDTSVAPGGSAGEEPTPEAAGAVMNGRDTQTASPIHHKGHAKTTPENGGDKKNAGANNTDTNSNGQQKMSKRQKKKNQDPRVLETRKKIQMCCASNDLATALEIYRGALANNIKIEAQSFYNLLNLCDGLDRNRVHVGTPKRTSSTATKEGDGDKIAADSEAPNADAVTDAPAVGDSNDTMEETTTDKASDKDDSMAEECTIAKDAPKSTAESAKPKDDESNAQDKKNGEKQPQSTAVRSVDLETRKKAAFEIKDQMGKQSIPLNETAYTALVKLLSRAKEVAKADALLEEAEGVQQCKVRLRLYSSLLIAYCQLGDLVHALKLWERLSKRDLVLTEKEYAALFFCCAKVGDAKVMQKVLTDLSEDVLVPSRETCRALVQWFESPFCVVPKKKESDSAAAATTDENDNKSETADILEKIVLPPALQTHETDPIGPVDHNVDNNDEENSNGNTHHPTKWQVSHGCRIDSNTGTLLDGCLEGKTLQQVKLSSVAWQKMIEMNETIALSGKLDNDKSQFQGGKKGRKRKLGDRDQEERARMWHDYRAFLQRERKRRQDADTVFDVVIDGANVGYFQTNYAGAPKHVEYQQIDNVVKHFVELNKKVLLVMHSRHFSHSLMPKRFRPMVQHWERLGILCKTPFGMNDDWFWMHAALLSGPGTLVVTNDEMRDHHFQMLAPRSFLRWKERHQVHFHFGEKDGNKPPPRHHRQGAGRSVVLIYPEVYSRRIQRIVDGYVIPLPKLGDENRFLDGTHTVEEDAPSEETYLCIRPFQSPDPK